MIGKEGMRWDGFVWAVVRVRASRIRASKKHKLTHSHETEAEKMCVSGGVGKICEGHDCWKGGCSGGLVIG